MMRRLHRWPALSLAAAGAAMLAVLLYECRHLDAQAASSGKLASILQDIADAVPQSGAAVGARAQSVTPFSIETMPKSVQDAVHARLLRVNTAGEVQVYVLMGVTSDTLRQLQAAGATVEIADAAHQRVQARLPVSELTAVASLPFVNAVRPPTYARTMTGSVETEGDAIMQSDVARQQFSLDGTGVRVGVISDGLKGLFASGCTACGGASGGPMSTGDLPAATGTRNSAGVLVASGGGITGQSFQSNSDLEGLPSGSCGFAGAGAEGTALLEIVHDIAPGAALSFSNADTDLAFNQAVNFLAAGNDVVMDDLGFYGEPGDGTSDVSVNTANALNSTTYPIRAYVTANGNSADENYVGTYVDSGVDGSSVSGVANTGHLQLFQSNATTTDVLGLGPQPYNLISLPNGGTVVIFLTWNDQAGHSSNNYDLYLARQSTGAVVASSTTVQSGAQDPVEAIAYSNSSGANDYFRILVQNVKNQAAAKQLRVMSFEPECATDGPRILVNGRHERHNFNTASQSVPAQSDSGGSPVSVISAGAICSASALTSQYFAGSAAPDESCNDTSHTTAEFFSSRGPTLDGRMKPDVSAIDGVSITGAGSFGSVFFGTSAAAPHTAGVAALLLQGASCLKDGATGAVDRVVARNGVRNLILSNATSMSGAPDNTFGAGLVNALAAVQHTAPSFGGAASQTIDGNTTSGADVTAADLGFTDPNSCAITRLSWTGGCGSSPDSALHCPFGTSQVDVEASNNGAAFSMAAGVQITVTNFSLSASPGSATVSAGQAGVYQLSVAPQNGAFTRAVSLSCSGLPAGASCAFGSSSPTPGAGGAQTSLTITTTKAASIVGAWRMAPPPVWPIALAAIGSLLLTIAWRVVPAASGKRVASGGVVTVAWALVIVVFAAAEFACGGGSSSGSSSGTPQMSLSPASLSFGSQIAGTSSAPLSFTIANSGLATVALTSISASGDFTQTNTCGSSLGAAGHCVVSVTFTPTAAGVRTGAVTITDNAAGSPQTVSLTGTGTGPPATPPGSYQITVTGTSGALTQTSVVTLIVQ